MSKKMKAVIKEEEIIGIGGKTVVYAVYIDGKHLDDYHQSMTVEQVEKDVRKELKKPDLKFDFHSIRIDASFDPFI